MGWTSQTQLTKDPSMWGTKQPKDFKAGIEEKWQHFSITNIWWKNELGGGFNPFEY